MTLKTAKGLALQDIFTEIHQYVHRGKLPNREYYTSTFWRRFILQWMVSEMCLELDMFGNHEL